jgi:glycolate oxidase
MRLPDIEISTAPEDLVCYGSDASGLRGSPSMVAWPHSSEEVAGLIKYASGKGLAIVPRGAGSGMTAGAVPGNGAIVLSLEKMNRILEVDSDNLNALVEPGVINGNLQSTLYKHGFFYPPDPASMDFCTIGGNVAENAGGPRALKYGVTRDYVMQLEAVLPNGETITAGVMTHKGVVGYDLARLLVGSEGTLAVFTKIRLRFLPLTEAVATLLASFSDVVSSGRTVSEITSSRMIPRTLEFMDREAIMAAESYMPTGLSTEAEAILLIELDGHPKAIEQEAGRVVDICRRHGGTVEMAADENARDRLWQCRRAISPALYHLGLMKINEDIVVPRSRLPEMLGILRKLSEQSGIKIVNFGHAGDGNIHVNIMTDRDDNQTYKKALTLVREIFQAVIGLGGTISGEHGVGLTKAEYVDMEIMKRELEIMRKIKGVFDPENLLNPGKIFGAGAQ